MLLIITFFTILAWCIAIFLFNFYRDPHREIPQGRNIVSAADGRVISIINTSKKPIKLRKGIFGKVKLLTKDVSKKCYAVSIFMSPLDVHYNRSPIEGTVKSVKYSKGRFFKAYDLEKSLENEKNEIVIEGKGIKVKVIQVAGFLARRVHSYVKSNQKVNKGDKIGLIALSSQTTMIVPASVDLKVKVGERVKGGETIIAALGEA